jgi:hypothetical protein
VKRALLAGMLCLGACATPPDPAGKTCTTARQAVQWAQIALALSCTKASKACDTAGLTLRAANTAVRAVCPVP